MRLTSWLSLISNKGAARRGSSRLSRRPQRVSLDRLETLEDRLLLTARYVDNPADYTITTDTGAAGLSAGDTVTWNGATPVAGLIFGTTAFSTIQSAVTFATAGDTINVAAGNYAENVVIGKALHLLGAQSNVTPIAGGRAGGESVINLVGGTTIGMQLNASGVEVNGFEFANQSFSIVTNNFGGGGSYQDVQIKNNYVHSNIANNGGIVLGLNVSGSTTTITNYTVSHNLVQVSGASAQSAIATAGSNVNYVGLNISDNDLSNSNGAAIVSLQPTASHSGTVIAGNDIHNSGYGMNIANGGNISIRDNSFHDFTSIGFQVGIVGGEVVRNTFTNIGTVTGGDVIQLWGGEFSTAVSANVNIANNTIHFNDNPTTTVHGIRLRAPGSGSGIDGTTIHVVDNTFIDGHARPLGSAFAVRNQGDPTKPVDASGNWWSTTNDSTIAALMSGPVEYSPYLSNGTDTDPLTPGFQGNGATIVEPNVVITPPAANGVADSFILKLVGSTLQVVTSPGGVVIDSRPFADVTSLTFNGTGDDDTFIVDFSNGNPIPAGGITFNGGGQGAGGDTLVVKGTGGQSAVYSPSATVTGNGVVTVNSLPITFTGLEPVDISGMALVTVTPAAAGNNLTITNGVDFATSTNQALVVSGTTNNGGTPIEAVALWNNTTVVINTATFAGNDSITIASANNANGITNLTVNTGTGADVLNVSGATTVAGTFTATVPTVNLTNNITAGTITGSASTINVNNNTAQIQDAIAISGTSSTVNIAAATYTENVNATGGGKSVTLAPVGTGTVTLNGNLDLNTGDAVQIQIAALGTLDNFVVNGTVTLGGATLATSLIGGYVPTVGDVFTIVTNDVADAVSGTFAGLAEGSVIILGSTRLKVSYIGGSGNDITLTALPPAVAVSFSNGNLVVTGTGNIDDFTIQVSGTNQVTLIGNNGTNFTGAGGDATTVGPFLVTGQLTVSTGNGNDIVHLSGSGPNARLDSGNVSIDLGAGNDTLTQIGPSPLRLTGNLSVAGGTGSDTVALGLTAGATDFIVANLTIDNGTDDNAATQSVTLNGLTANGNVTVTNSGNALQSVVLGAAATVISGNLKITQSGSANTLGYSVVADNAPVGGSVSITNGNTTGSTLVDWATSNVGGSTVVTNGNATGNNAVLFTSNVLTGSAIVKNGNAAINSITVDGSTLNGNSSSFTNGSATTSNTINLGLNAASTFAGVVLATNSSATGANSIIVQRGSLNGGATLSNNVAGAASNTVTVGNIDTVSVVGNLSINNANSTTSNNVNVDRLLTSGNKSGDVSINNGTSNTTNVNLGATISNTIAGNLTVRNQATVGTRTTNVSRTTVNGGSGFYLFNVGAGNSSTGIGLASPTVVLNKLKIEDGSGTAALNIRAATLGSLNFLDVGGGADTVDIAGNGGVGVVTINGATRIDTGAASDLVRIGTTGTAVFNDSVFISLGAGDDTLTIGDNASSPAFSTASKLSFDGGAGVDSASVSTLSVADYELVAPNKLSKKLKQKIKGFETLT